MQQPGGPPPGAMPSPDVSGMMAEGMMKQAQGQKTDVTSAPPPADPQQSPSAPHTQQFQHQQAPRDVGTVVEEAKLIGQDVVDTISENVLAMLGLSRQPKDPGEAAKIQQFHQKYQALDAQQQQVAQQRLQAEAQKKQMEEEEQQMRKQQEEEAKQNQGLDIPQGKVSGQAAMDKMQQDRKGMGGASG